MATVDTPRLSDSETADALIYAGQKILRGGTEFIAFFFFDYAENLEI